VQEESGFYQWTCGVCGSANELFVEPSAGSRQEFTEDCTVCCSPHEIAVRIHAGGTVVIEASPA
jgi:hypothetical protein